MTESTLTSKPMQTGEHALELHHREAATNCLMSIWASVIGKKVVMAVTGAIFFLFLLAHMVGNLKIFLGPTEINSYSHFLREVGWPELGYGQLLWIVRIVLLICVGLHVLAAIQL